MGEPVIEADSIGEPLRMPSVRLPRNRHARNRKVYGVSAAGHIVAAKGYTNDGAEILGPGRRPPRRPEGPPGEEQCLSATVHPSQERALVVSGRFGNTRVFEIDLESGESTLLFDHPTARAAYVGDELLVCLADGTLTLSRFRPEDEAPVTLGTAPAPGNTLLTVLHDRRLVITDGSADRKTLSTRLFAASGEGLELVGRLTLNGPQPEKLIFCSSWQDTGERIVFSADRVGFRLRPTDHPSLAGLRASESEPVSAPEKEPHREPGAVRDIHLHPLGQKVESLHGNGDEKVHKRRPKWKDVDAELAHLEAGRRQSVWLFLDGGQDQSPHLAAIRETEGGETLLLLEYGSFDCELSAGARSMDEVRAVFHHFFDEKELRAEDGWEYV